MKKRLISVALTLPLFLIIMFNNKFIFLFHILILSISILSAFEIFYMAKIHRYNNMRSIITTIIAMIIAYIIIMCNKNIYKLDFSNLYTMINYKDINIGNSLIVIFALITALFSINMIKFNVSFEEKGRAIITAIFCFIYVGIGVWHLTILRFYPAGKYLIIFILLCSWFSDTGGYVIGKKIGKHKLSNSASPNKSIEGLFGMFIFTIPLTILYYYLYTKGYLTKLLGEDIPKYSLAKLVILSIIFTTTGFLGDMGESLIKRMYDSKDSSKIFPGHGGIFDIFDSVILTTPLAYYIFLIF